MAFVPTWYLLMRALTLSSVRDRGCISSERPGILPHHGGLNALSLIVGFAVFAALRRILAFDRRRVLSGYRHGVLIDAKSLAISLVASGVAGYAAIVLLAY